LSPELKAPRRGKSEKVLSGKKYLNLGEAVSYAEQGNTTKQ
jgi:hypothetical protein